MQNRDNPPGQTASAFRLREARVDEGEGKPADGILTCFANHGQLPEASDRGKQRYRLLVRSNKTPARMANATAMGTTHLVAGMNLCPQYGQTRTFRPTPSWQAGHVFMAVNLWLHRLGVNGKSRWQSG